jgi:putative membrane protein
MEPIDTNRGHILNFTKRGKIKMKKIVTIAGLLLLPVSLFARWGNDCRFDGFIPGQGSWFGGNFFNGGTFMITTTLILLGLVLFFAYGFAKNKKILDGKTGSAFDIAKIRYAKGEISKEEFEIIKADIG